MAAANRRARIADVPGLERLLLSIPNRDAALGARRPDAVAALVAAVEAKLDAARQLQLARDRWALRAPDLRSYRAGDRRRRWICSASCSRRSKASSRWPARRRRRWPSSSGGSARILKLVSGIVPPEEMAAAHALLVSAVQLAGHSAEIRREAVLAGDMTRAWDASSAAAGALMLAAKARADIQSAAAAATTQVITPRRTQLGSRHRAAGVSQDDRASTRGSGSGSGSGRVQGSPTRNPEPTQNAEPSPEPQRSRRHRRPDARGGCDSRARAGRRLHG